MKLLRRDPDLADPHELKRQLEHEQDRTERQAVEITHLKETMRHLREALDTYKGRNRELIADNLALRAQLRGQGS